MSAIKQAINHFDGKATRKIEVPEWDMTLYTKNLSVNDKKNWTTRANGDNHLYVVYALIFGVTDENGEPVFTVADKHDLLHNVDAEIVSRIANEVFADTTEEDREKNS